MPGGVVLFCFRVDDSNKSPGVRGIPPKVLMETVEQVEYHLQECSMCH